MFLRNIQRFTKTFTPIPHNFFATLPQRHPFSKLGKDDLSYFSTILQPHEIVTDQTELDQHNTDWKKNYKGNSSLMLRPNSTEKISKIMKYCFDKNLAVVPQGGNTGLVGGSVPIFDEIILSLSNLKKVHEFSPHSAVLTCEAGCVLEDLNNQVGKDGYEIPLDLGAKGSCQIGGNIATHAGGIHFIKHGPFRGNLLGLEVVLPDGNILNLESKVRKDNTGLDLKQMFIGSEGTLGIVTKANIQCVKKDEFSRVLFIRTTDYNEVLKINELTRKVAGKNLSAIEFFDDYAYYSVVNNIPGVNPPFEVGKNYEYYYVLVELAGSQPLDNLEETYFNALSDANLANECVLCENEGQAQNLWKIREQIATASNHMGSFLIYDFSVDIKQWMDLVVDIRKRTEGKGFTVAYGHIGDGNLHVNIVYTEQDKKEELMDILEPSTFDWLFKRQGSISAEHGIGFMKANFLNYAKQDNVIRIIEDIKKVFDPKPVAGVGLRAGWVLLKATARDLSLAAAGGSEALLASSICGAVAPMVDAGALRQQSTSTGRPSSGSATASHGDFDASDSFPRRCSAADPPLLLLGSGREEDLFSQRNFSVGSVLHFLGDLCVNFLFLGVLHVTLYRHCLIK